MPEKKKFIEDLICKLDTATGEILCKINEEQFKELSKSKPPKRITFELKEE